MIIEDAPLSALPADESAALETLEGELAPLFDRASTTLLSDDPWLSLTPSERAHLYLRFARYHLLRTADAHAHIQRVAALRKAEAPWRLALDNMQRADCGVIMHFEKARGFDGEVLAYSPARAYYKPDIDHERQKTALRTFFEYIAYREGGRRAASIVLVLDLDDIGRKNVDLTATRAGIRLFLEQYPEMFKKIVVTSYPTWIYGSKFCEHALPFFRFFSCFFCYRIQSHAN